MAQRRMFTLKIVDSDAFLDMPISSQVLYFHLAMRADDDGFIGNPKKIMRVVGTNEDDMKVLIAKRFILTFQSGVIVVKHWKMHNYIQNDRYSPTQYLEEKKALTTKENGSYTERIQDGYTLEPQGRVGKVRLGKERIERAPSPNSSIKILDDPTTIKQLEEKFPGIDVPKQLEVLKDWLAAKGRVQKDYVAFARNWLRKPYAQNKLNNYQKKGVTI